MDPEVGGDLLDRHPSSRLQGNPHDIVTELFGVRPGHSNILPAHHLFVHEPRQAVRQTGPPVYRRRIPRLRRARALGPDKPLILPAQPARFSDSPRKTEKPLSPPWPEKSPSAQRSSAFAIRLEPYKNGQRRGGSGARTTTAAAIGQAATDNSAITQGAVMATLGMSRK